MFDVANIGGEIHDSEGQKHFGRRQGIMAGKGVDRPVIFSAKDFLGGVYII